MRRLDSSGIPVNPTPGRVARPVVQGHEDPEPFDRPDGAGQDVAAVQGSGTGPVPVQPQRSVLRHVADRLHAPAERTW